MTLPLRTGLAPSARAAGNLFDHRILALVTGNPDAVDQIVSSASKALLRLCHRGRSSAPGQLRWRCTKRSL
jgi:hypothetical protein